MCERRFDISKDNYGFYVWDNYRGEYVDLGDGILLNKEEVDEVLEVRDWKDMVEDLEVERMKG